MDRLNSERSTVATRDANGAFLLSIFQDGGEVLSRFGECVNFHRLDFHNFDAKGGRRNLQWRVKREQWCTKLHRADQQIGVIRINIELSHQGQRLF